MLTQDARSNCIGKQVVVKSVRGHWRLQNEAEVLARFQSRAPSLRPLVDEIVDPADPPAIVLKYLDSDLLVEPKKKTLARPEIKFVARKVLEALKVLHEGGYVHTGTEARARLFHCF